MKRLAVTQRVDVIGSYGERRDSLDQQWIKLLHQLNYWPVFVANDLSFAKCLVEAERIDGVLLTGGNSLASCGGDAPERDEVENFLLRWAIETDVPVLGVCRGMQIIQEYFSNPLEVVKNHVRSHHSLTVLDGFRLSDAIGNLGSVNAYHDYGAKSVQGELRNLASSSDGVVMAVEHFKKRVFGIMWHSEREMPFNDAEKRIFKEVFGE